MARCAPLGCAGPFSSLPDMGLAVVLDAGGIGKDWRHLEILNSGKPQRDQPGIFGGPRRHFSLAPARLRP